MRTPVLMSGQVRLLLLQEPHVRLARPDSLHVHPMSPVGDRMHLGSRVASLLADERPIG